MNRRIKRGWIVLTALALVCAAWSCGPERRGGGGGSGEEGEGEGGGGVSEGEGEGSGGVSEGEGEGTSEGEGEEGEGERLDFSMDGDTQLKDLTDAEVTRLCQEGAEYYEEHVPQEWTCMMLGLIVGAFAPQNQVATCESAYDDCMGKPRDLGDCGFEENPAARQQCPATLDEMEACMNDSMAQLRAMEDVTCEVLTQPSEGEGEETPASCQLVEQKCPEMKEDPEE